MPRCVARVGFGDGGRQPAFDTTRPTSKHAADQEAVWLEVQACATPGHFDYRSDVSASVSQIHTLIDDAGVSNLRGKVRRDWLEVWGMRRLSPVVCLGQ
jgi:hypothetical protein